MVLFYMENSVTPTESLPIGSSWNAITELGPNNYATYGCCA